MFIEILKIERGNHSFELFFFSSSFHFLELKGWKEEIIYLNFSFFISVFKRSDKIEKKKCFLINVYKEVKFEMFQINLHSIKLYKIWYLETLNLFI
jgi:hypothetical protein